MALIVGSAYAAEPVVVSHPCAPLDASYVRRALLTLHADHIMVASCVLFGCIALMVVRQYAAEPLLILRSCTPLAYMHCTLLTLCANCIVLA